MPLFDSSRPSGRDRAGDQAPSAGGLLARLDKTRRSLAARLWSLAAPGHALDEAVFEQIEDQLLLADLGVAATERIMQRLRQSGRQPAAAVGGALLPVFRSVLLEVLAGCQPPPLALRKPDRTPYVILLAGVNGVGKTTTCAKLAAQAQARGERVMLAACDTFRAAATEQLQSWGRQLSIPVIAQGHGADAAAVAHDAYSAALARKCDLLLIDSAGRQHTEADLMAQLKKIRRVLAKAAPGIPDQVWLTVDAGNGQNVISQVTHFDRAIGLDGLCITKLDGTARGGIVVALAERFGLPVHYLGTGEQLADLRPFDAGEFVAALLPEQVAGIDQ